MSQRPEFTTLEYRNKVRKLATEICRAGHNSMRKHMHIINAARYLNRYYRIDLFKPYPFQLKWFRSGADYKLRLLSAANQIGKTVCGGAEFSYHATGQYPNWWNGYERDASIMWAFGVSRESTCKVLQKELLGTADYRKKDELGTGTIPREFIDFDSFVADGELAKSFRVWNIQGGYSEVHFYYSTQDEKVLMGQRVGFGWIDEQSEREQEIIAQCTMRTANTGGVIAVTATPEVGVTEFYTQCKEDKTGAAYFQNATWDDAPHFTPEVVASMLARIPYYQRKMRSQGIPILGDGAIYPYSDEQITCAPFDIPDHWLVIAACDFGYSGISDPSVIVFVAYNPETGCRYLFQEWGNVDDRDDYANSHLPDYMARKLIGCVPDDWQENSHKSPNEFEGLGLPSISVMLPPDGDGIQAGTQKTRGELMTGVGAVVCSNTFEIPEDMAPMENNRRSLVGSISILGQWFQDGNLKIFNTCTETLRELRLYQWKRRGIRTIPSDKDNHYLDAMRYGAIRVRDNGVHLYEARKPAGSDIYEITNPYDEDMGAYNL
ncbi:terminase large subunit domain-containing protein [Buttiauxella brennerae]|uniref:terminase large subunit domain-containing protein n=1 Tax=Buttiauxella brennerae TaxID=82988 RepID=UPI00286ED4F9|nr:terminase family protein [Buttiauxella brennerae]